MPQTFLDKGQHIVWFKEADIPANLGAISVATDMSKATDMSDLTVVDSSEFLQTGSDSISEKVYSDVGKVDIPTDKNGQASAVFRRVVTALGAPDTTDPLALFDNRQLGVFVIFTLQAEADVPAAGDEYFYIKVRADECNPDTKPHGGFAKLTVGFKFSGAVGTSKLVA